MVDKGSLSDKPSGAAVEGSWSNKNGPNFWHCGKPGHVQRNCKERNSLGAVAAIAPNGEPPVRVLAQEDVEANVCREEETTRSQIRSGTVDSVGGTRRPHCPQKGCRQRKERKQLKGGGDPPTNPPLWMK